VHGTGHHAVNAGLAGSAILLERGHFILGVAKINARTCLDKPGFSSVTKKHGTKQKTFTGFYIYQ